MKKILFVFIISAILINIAGCSNPEKSTNTNQSVITDETKDLIESKETSVKTQKLPEVTETFETEEKYETFAEKIQVKYNGVVFGTGDKMSEIIDSLGAQSSEKKVVPSCYAASNVDEYYFPSMKIQVYEDSIFYIDISDNGFYSDTKIPQTVLGLSLKSQPETITELYGPNDSKFAPCYSEGHKSIEIYTENSAVVRILMLDNSFFKAI